LKNPKQLERFGAIAVEQKCRFECLLFAHAAEHLRSSHRSTSRRASGVRRDSRHGLRAKARASRDAIDGVPRLAPYRFETVESRLDVVHIARTRSRHRECRMDELNGRMMACEILVTGLIARVANNSPDPLRFLTDFRDEIKAVVKGVNIAGMENTDRVRRIAQAKVDELFSLMKPPSAD
jgi:hypothetical protein